MGMLKIFLISVKPNVLKEFVKPAVKIVCNQLKMSCLRKQCDSNARRNGAVRNGT